MPQPVTPAEAAAWLAQPGPDDDKYSRGVLGVITGSARYPGAAVLGVDAALHTGVGMVRYVGPDRAADFVLARRPEAVVGMGRVQAWLVGSGMSADDRDDAATAQLAEALGQGVPAVIDAGALDLVDRASGPALLTPHAGELATLLGADRDAIRADPVRHAREAVERTGATVLLKGSTTHVLAPSGLHLTASVAPGWLATAGAGDALGGILGALVATHAQRIEADPDALAHLGAVGAVLHGLAAERASGGGPLTITGLIEAVPATVAAVLHGGAA